MKDSGEIYHYNSTGANAGIWTKDGVNKIRSLSQRLLGHRSKRYRINETVIWIKNRTQLERDEFTSPLNLIVLNNGVYDLESKTLRSFAPEYLATIKLPITYNPKAKCPKIREFLPQVASEEDVKILIQFIGYCLYRDIPIHRVLLLHGSGANGKSTFVFVVRALLGEKNVKAIPLQSLCTDRFASAELDGILGNFYPDLPKKAVSDTGPFKGLTAGDEFTVQKKFQHPFDMKPFAKHIFSANEVPTSYDLSMAFFRRWLIVDFPNTFEGKDANPNLIHELTTDEELSGLFNWAVNELEQLLERGKFLGEKTWKERRLQYIKRSNSVQYFVEIHLKSEPRNVLPKGDLYEIYNKWCHEKGTTPVASHIFSRQLKRFIPVSEMTQNTDGKRVKCWTDIGFKTIEDSDNSE